MGDHGLPNGSEGPFGGLHHFRVSMSHSPESINTMKVTSIPTVKATLPAKFMMAP